MIRLRKALTLCSLLLIAILPSLWAQEEVEMRIGQVDVSNFPTVRFNLFSADSRRVPLSINELQGLSLREAGIPIAEYEVQTVPVGVDVVFVIDGNPDIVVADENSSRSRYQTVQEAIGRFAERVMSPSGLDRVTIVVADEANVNGRLLITDASDPQAVNQAINNYTPLATEPVPLNEMMLMAVEHAAEIQENGRFQAVLLLSDAIRINQQLDYNAIVTAAQAIDLPLYGAILGAGASPDEIGNMADLYEPTRATYAHLPTVEPIDPIYLIWQRQANQVQIMYRSLLTASGSYPLNVNVGTLLATTTLDLTVEPPIVTIGLAQAAITRIGTATDTPLAELEPTAVPLTVAVRWPDRMPRQITAVNWFINDQPQPLLDDFAFDTAGELVLAWDITNVDAGVYEHRVQVADELGQTADSELVSVTIGVERPLPPTATPAPTAASETAASTSQPVNTGEILFLLGIVAIIAFLLLLLRRARRRRQPKSIKPKRKPKQTAVTATEATSQSDKETLQPFLEIVDAPPGSLSRIPIYGDNITIGRDEALAQIILKDMSISALHARIRQRGQDYWLYDEGSGRGVSLNYEKLGIAPHMLRNGDTIQIGRISLRFHLTARTKPDAKPESIAADEKA
jgi:hypothetical protein